MELDQRFGQWQAKPGPFLLPPQSPVHLLKTGEGRWNILCGDSDSGI